mgnify:CR=1 FL=1
MRVVGLELITAFIKKHPAGKGAIETWYYDTKKGCWKNSMDIKNRYANASFLVENHVVFNLRGNKFRLVTCVAYNTGIVMVKWIGTHAEYSRKIFP